MDVLFSQLRTKYPHGAEESKERNIPTGDQGLPHLKTQSYKEKRNKSWVKRQFSKQMSQGYDSNAEGDYKFAVAAAAFAIKSLEKESNTLKDDRLHHHYETDAPSSTKFNTKPDYLPRVSDPPHTRSIRFSDEISKINTNPQGRILQEPEETIQKPPEKQVGLVPAIKKKLSFADNTPISQSERALATEKPIGTIPSIKKPLNLNRQFSNKQEKPEAMAPQPPPSSSSVPLKEPPFLSRNAKPEITKNGIMGNTDAEWEKTEMSRMKEKYDKLNSTIHDWENKKKSKAKRRLVKIQADLDKRRAKAMQQYHREVARIDGIAGGARSKAIENRKNEELKAREKANKIKMTEKLPKTCLCC